MHTEKMVSAQLMEWIHPEQFRRCLGRYQGQHKVRNYSCWDQFLALTFAQVTERASRADIEVCLRSHRAQLYHLGLRSAVAQSTRADAQASRAWRRYADLAQGLLGKNQHRVGQTGSRKTGTMRWHSLSLGATAV